jgi:putative peptidoglycan lipid II flippase
LPTVIALLGGLKPSFAIDEPPVRQTISRFVPILLGRGSVQLSSYVDQLLASYIGNGIVAAMANAQTLYLLPVSLFGASISASELTEMSSAIGSDAERAEHLRTRLRGSLRRVVFFVVPSAVAFIAIGGPMIAMLFQSGRFTAHDTTVVWTILAGSALGLSAGTQGRLLSSAFYALGDPNPPLHAALVRVAVTTVLGYSLALPLRHAFGYSEAWGAFGLTASAGFAAWIEFLLLERWLSRRIGKVTLPTRLGFGALGAATIAGAAAYGAAHVAAAHVTRAWMVAPIAVPVFGAIYLGIMLAARVPETRALTKILRR